MNAIMVKIFDTLAKVGLDKLERALIFGAVLVTVLALAVGAVEMSQRMGCFLVPVAACGLRRDVDRAPVVLQFRADPVNAEDPR